MRRAVRTLIHSAGFEVTRYLPRNYLHLRRVELLSSGRYSVLVDVGADDGGWAAHARSGGFTGRIVSFEPRTDAYRALETRAGRDPRWSTHQVALSERAGVAPLNVAGQASSLLPEGEQVAYAPETAYTGTETVPLARLDDLRVLVDGDDAYMKIDVQGHELAVLTGAERTLERAAAVELELSFVPLYAGQPLAHDLMAFMHDRGFRLASIEVSWRDRATGDLLVANGLFLR